MTDNRPEPPERGDERATLTGFLDWQRATLWLKCEGLSDEQLRQHAVPPSTLSLLGLLRHTTDVERVWYRRFLGSGPITDLYSTTEDPDGDFDNLDETAVAEVVARWRAACEESRRITAAASLDDVSKEERCAVSLRWILTHLIEEYARHNGHADFLRERIDGATGE